MLLWSVTATMPKPLSRHRCSTDDTGAAESWECRVWTCRSILTVPVIPVMAVGLSLQGPLMFPLSPGEDYGGGVPVRKGPSSCPGISPCTPAFSLKGEGKRKYLALDSRSDILRS